MPPSRSAVILFVKNFLQRRHTHGHADHFFGVAEEIGGQAVILREVGNEHRFAERAENIHAIQEIARINFVAVGQVFQGHFHDREHLFALHLGFLHKQGLGAAQHVQRDIGHRPETAALDQDALFVKGVGGLDDLAVGGKQGGVGQAALHQLQRHKAVVQDEQRPAR